MDTTDPRVAIFKCGEYNNAILKQTGWDVSRSAFWSAFNDAIFHGKFVPRIPVLTLAIMQMYTDIHKALSAAIKAHNDHGARRVAPTKKIKPMFNFEPWRPSGKKWGGGAKPTCQFDYNRDVFARPPSMDWSNCSPPSLNDVYFEAFIAFVVRSLCVHIPLVHPNDIPWCIERVASTARCTRELMSRYFDVEHRRAKKKLYANIMPAIDTVCRTIYGSGENTIVEISTRIHAFSKSHDDRKREATKQIVNNKIMRTAGTSSGATKRTSGTPSGTTKRTSGTSATIYRHAV